MSFKCHITARQAQRWMPGTGPGIFLSSLSFFKSAGGAPGLHLWLWGLFFSPRRSRKKNSVEYLLFSSFSLCSLADVFEEREKKIFFFFFKGARFFPETGCWKHFTAEFCWPEVCSYLHQGESAAIWRSSLGVLWQAAPLRRGGVSSPQPSCSAGPATVQAPCQVAEWV